MRESYRTSEVGVGCSGLRNEWCTRKGAWKTLTEFGEDGDEEGSSYDIGYRTIGWFYRE